MPMKEKSTDIGDGYLLSIDLSGLNEIYRDIASEIGIENTVAIFQLFHGTQITFPNRLFSKEYTYNAIVQEYNGKNALQLAQKYNYSERTIWRILKITNEKQEDYYE